VRSVVSINNSTNIVGNLVNINHQTLQQTLSHSNNSNSDSSDELKLLKACKQPFKQRENPFLESNEINTIDIQKDMNLPKSPKDKPESTFSKRINNSNFKEINSDQRNKLAESLTRSVIKRDSSREGNHNNIKHTKTPSFDRNERNEKLQSSAQRSTSNERTRMSSSKKLIIKESDLFNECKESDVFDARKIIHNSQENKNVNNNNNNNNKLKYKQNIPERSLSKEIKEKDKSNTRYEANI